MKVLPILISAALAVALSCNAGTITGKVSAEGKPGTETGGAAGNYDSRKFKFVPKVDYSGMRDFVVYIEGRVGTNALVPPTEPARVQTKHKIAQKGAMFDPHVLPVLVGTTVEWPNQDDIYHNVFSYSEPRQFDLGLYKDGDAKTNAVKTVLFDRPGRVDVFCSIHTTMNCVVLVLENPYFASAKDNGIYSITNVPAGNYRLVAWHERLPSLTNDIVVPADGVIKMDFVLGIKNLPKY